MYCLNSHDSDTTGGLPTLNECSLNADIAFRFLGIKIADYALATTSSHLQNADKSLIECFQHEW